jgi:hypothetical protein
MSPIDRMWLFISITSRPPEFRARVLEAPGGGQPGSIGRHR